MGRGSGQGFMNGSGGGAGYGGGGGGGWHGGGGYGGGGYGGYGHGFAPGHGMGLGGHGMLFPGGEILFLLFWIAVAALLAVAFWQMFRKAGYEGALGLLMLVPVVNLGAVLFLAFSEWPALKAVHSAQPAEVARAVAAPEEVAPTEVPAEAAPTEVPVGAAPAEAAAAQETQPIEAAPEETPEEPDKKKKSES
jgi:hypothetical protein